MKPIDKQYNFLRPIETQNLIRLGSNCDGGYIVDKKIIDKCENLVSFGLGEDWSFELDFIQVHQKANIHIYDHTINIYPYIKNFLKNLKRLLIFRSSLNNLKLSFENLLRYAALKMNKNIKVYREKIVGNVKNKIDTDITKVFKRIEEKKRIILKVDIEESEFEIIQDILKYKDKIEMLIFEFHWIKKNEKKFKKAINELCKDFFIIHIHGNNHCEITDQGVPEVLEVTLVKKVYLPEKILFTNKFPLEKLDFPNNPHKKDLEFFFNE